MQAHHCPNCGHPQTMQNNKITILGDNDRSVIVDGNRRRMGPVQWEILTLLSDCMGEWVAAARIYDKLYSDYADPPFDTVIRVHVHHLRRKLKGSGYQITSLKGAGGLGYRLEMVPQ